MTGTDLTLVWFTVVVAYLICTVLSATVIGRWQGCYDFADVGLAVALGVLWPFMLVGLSVLFLLLPLMLLVRWLVQR